jgi:hypothetical protein
MVKSEKGGSKKNFILCGLNYKLKQKLEKENMFQK